MDFAVEHEADVIMQAGDFGIWTHTTHGVQYLEELQRYLDKHQQVLYFVDGNHENFDHLYDIPLEWNGLRKVKDNIIHIPRGHVLEWEDLRIMGFGGANSIDGPNGASWWSQGRGMYNDRYGNQIDLGGWWPQEDITQEQVDAVDKQQVDILLTHECPQGVQIPGIHKTYTKGMQQRALMSQVVEKVEPSLLVHGHYHVRYTSTELEGTRVIGLGDNGGSLNNMVYLLDTEDMNGIL